MSERAEFIKKIEDELRKPKPDQNSELVAFWKDELDRAPNVGSSVVNMANFKADLSADGISVDDAVLDRLLVTNATGVALASTAAQRRAVYFAAASEPRSRTRATLKEQGILMNKVHFYNDKTINLTALSEGKPSLLKIAHDIECAKLEVQNSEMLLKGKESAIDSETFLGSHYLAGPYKLIDLCSVERGQRRGGVLMKHYSTALNTYVDAGAGEVCGKSGY